MISRRALGTTPAISAILAAALTACSPPASTPPAPSATAAVTPAAGAGPAASAAQPAAANTLTCDGPITPATTEAQLRQRYGDANVTAGPIYAAEGMSVPGLLVHANDPARRLELIRSTNEPRRILSVSGGPAWTGPSGLRVGSTLADVERANGRPFTVSGFGWDYGGWVLDWRGGSLAAAENAPCRVGVRLATGETAPAAEGAMGEGSFASDSAAVRSHQAVISEWSVDFNVPGAVQPEPDMPS